MNPLSNKQPSGNVAFTEDQARHIKYRLCVPRDMGGEGRTVAEAATIYGVCRETIRRILRGETWGWLLPGPHQDPNYSADVQAKADQSVERFKAMLAGSEATVAAPEASPVPSRSNEMFERAMAAFKAQQHKPEEKA